MSTSMKTTRGDLGEKKDCTSRKGAETQRVTEDEGKIIG